MDVLNKNYDIIPILDRIVTLSDSPVGISPVLNIFQDIRPSGSPEA
jgi:hypothetical protein